MSDRESRCTTDAITEELHWYALTVKHQHEKQVAEGLRQRGLEALLPLYRARRRWSDRIKELELPLFAGYVFCRFPFAHRLPVLNTPGVGGIVVLGRRPTPVADQEIADIRTVIASKLPLEPWPHLRAGDVVRIDEGPLRGLEGTLLRVNDAYRVVVGVELLQRSIAVHLDPAMVSLLRRPSSHENRLGSEPGTAKAAHVCS